MPHEPSSPALSISHHNKIAGDILSNKTGNQDLMPQTGKRAAELKLQQLKHLQTRHVPEQAEPQGFVRGPESDTVRSRAEPCLIACHTTPLFTVPFGRYALPSLLHLRVRFGNGIRWRRHCHAHCHTGLRCSHGIGSEEGYTVEGMEGQ